MKPLSIAEVERRFALLDNSDTDDFNTLAGIAGLYPQRDLRFADWAGVDFSGSDLRGMDFTGARLHGCRFDGARIAGARFDMAELGSVEHMNGPWRRENPHAPGVVGPVADLRFLLLRFSSMGFAPATIC